MSNPFSDANNWIANRELMLNCRFGVVFMIGGVVPNLIDMRFQKVSGLSLEVDTQTVKSGGQNMFRQQLPNEIKHGNLTLERGQTLGVSPLNLELTATFNLFTFLPGRVLIMKFSEDMVPASGWLLEQTFPVKWEMGDLDAESKSISIEKLELAYNRMVFYQL